MAVAVIAGSVDGLGRDVTAEWRVRLGAGASGGHANDLPVYAEAADLQRFCAKHGEVAGVEIKGTKAKITMDSGADAAGKALNGHVVHRTTLEIVVNHEEDWWP